MKTHFFLLFPLMVSCFLSSQGQPLSKGPVIIPGPYSLEGRGTFPEGKHGPKENPGRRAWEEYRMLANPRTGKIPRKIEEKSLAYVNSRQSNLQGRMASFVRQQGGAWTHRGPFNVGGRTRALALDIGNENIILAGGVSGGLWRSVNSGGSWTKVSGPSDLQSITSIAQDIRPGHEATWYFTSGEWYGNSANGGRAPFSGNGVYKSTDGGLSWVLLQATASNTPEEFDSDFDYSWRVQVHPLNGDVYVATYGGIYRSQDEGKQWKKILNGRDAQFTDIRITPSGKLYATISSDGVPKKGMFRSEDGNTWTEITPVNFPFFYRRIVMDYAPANEHILYFMAETPGAGKLDHTLLKYVYQEGIGDQSGSEGNGGVWTDLSDNIPALGGRVGDFDSQGSYNLVLAIHPTDTSTVYLGGTNLYRSTDGFTSEENTALIGGYAGSENNGQYPGSHPDMHALVFFPSNPLKLLTGHDGGSSVTMNNLANFSAERPVSWVDLNNGYLTTQAYSVAINEAVENDPYLAAGFQDNYTYATNQVNGKIAWTQVLGGDGSFCAITQGGLVHYYSSQVASIYRYEYDLQGNFLNWARVTPAGMDDPLFITPFVIDPNDQEIMYLPDDDLIWRNHDLSAIPKGEYEETEVNWERLGNTRVSDEIITALDVSTDIAHRLYYGTDQGKVFRLDSAQTGNPIPEEISSPDFPEDGYVSCIKVDPVDADRIFVVFSNYKVNSIFFSPDGGKTWSDISGNLEQRPDGSGNGPSVRWLEILQLGSQQVYFAGTSTGLYSTQFMNGKETLWTQEGPETIGNVVINMIKTRDDGTVVVATHGNGIFSAQIEYLRPQPDFRADTAIVRVGQPVNFFDQSTQSPSSWEWSFPGAAIDQSTEQDPQGIIYAQPGCYAVSLTVSNEAGSQTRQRPCFINVLPDSYDGCTCDTLTNIKRGEALTLYSSEDNLGYFAGHNAYRNTLYAERYTVADSGEIFAFRLFPAIAREGVFEGNITFRVWTDREGLPDKLLYSELYPIRNFDTTQINTRSLSQPVKVGGTFHIGMGIEYDNGDTLALANAINRGAGGANTMSVFDENQWYSVPDWLNSNDFNTSMAFSPIFCRDSIAGIIDTFACQIYTAPDGRVYTEPGQYTALLTNEAGCDSTVFIHLDIQGLNDSVYQEDNRLFAFEGESSYRWLHCDQAFREVAFATDSSFVPLESGSYAVEISRNGCVDTSQCVAINAVSILANTFGSTLRVYPNPTPDRVHIALGEVYTDVRIKVRNTLGQVIAVHRLDTAEALEIPLGPLPGVYFLEIATRENRYTTFSVMKI